MKVETKFNVGDKVQHIHNSHKENKGKLQFIVLQIFIEICHGGAQAWYSCRPMISIADKWDKEDKADKKEIRFDQVKLSEIELVIAD